MNPVSFFDGTVPLSKDVHRELHLETGLGYGFAKKLTSVPVLTAELPELIKYYPVAFLEKNETVCLAALVGLQEEKNLFVSGDGTWSADYTPLILRLYPFLARLATVDDEKTGFLHIAENHPGLNKEAKGVALFNESGELSEFTSKIQSMASQFARNSLASQVICDRIKELELLSTMRAEIKNEAGEGCRVSGFQIVSREKLNGLEPEALKNLQKSGALEAIYLHLLSLRNLRALASLSLKDSDG